MERRVYAVPSALREQFVLTDGFTTFLKQWGWTLADHRPIYTDPQVICQRWLLASSGMAYHDRTFYQFFGEWHFRMFLRQLLAPHPTAKEAFLVCCPDESKRASYITFLHDQDMLLYMKQSYGRGPALDGIQDIGHTLEWWSAEWLRRSFAHLGQIPARHGVVLTELMHQGDAGDLDVMAFLRNTRLLMECKSSLQQVDLVTLNLFLWRAALLEPDLALLLIDAPSFRFQQRRAKARRRLVHWQIRPLEGSEEHGVYWNAGGPIAARGPFEQSVYWDRGNIYVALSTEHTSLEFVLETVLHHYQMHQT